jgi:RNA polymerase sigma factor (sigma-70 family)
LHEPDLIARLKDGREDAFSELVESYKDRVYNTALGLLRQEAEAEEVTQEVFIRVFERIGGFKGESSLATWLYRITVTSALDHQRRLKRKKRGGLLVTLFSRSDTVPDPPDFQHPGVLAEQKERSVLLFRAIGQLPAQQQAAFVLQQLEGLGQQEIADVLQTTVSAVESLLQRAKANLRKELAHHIQSKKS